MIYKMFWPTWIYDDRSAFYGNSESIWSLPTTWWPTAWEFRLTSLNLVLSRNAKNPRFSNPDRLFWIFLKRIWSRWKGALLILQPQTVVGWHRAGFRMYFMNSQNDLDWHGDFNLAALRNRSDLLNTFVASTGPKPRKVPASGSVYELNSKSV